MKKHVMILRAVGLVLLVVGMPSCSSLKGRKAAMELFNGKDLSGWSYVSADPQVKMEEVWSVQDGILTCRGKPVGAIYRGPFMKNFMLGIEYRWPPGGEAGNSGVFSRIGELKPIPQAVEVQLLHGSAGDVLGLQGRKVAPGQARFFEIKKHPLAGDIAGVKKVADREKPPGEWNRLEILALGSRYKVWLNGQVVNQVDGVEELVGPVGLQSEGSAIQFRLVRVVQLD